MGNSIIRLKNSRHRRPGNGRIASRVHGAMVTSLRVRLLLLTTGVASLGAAASPLENLQASLTMEKQQYFVGEPLTLTFTARNAGRRRIELSESDPYGQCSDYRIAVTPDEPKLEPKTGPPCAPLFQIQDIQCLIGSLVVIKGTETTQRMLLNRLHDFTRPGTYTVKVTRHLMTSEISASFTFNLASPSSPDDLKQSFTAYRTELSSSNYRRRQEAAIIMASLPAPFLEPDLLRMLSTPGLTWEGIRGLRKLNSEQARQALYHLLEQDNSSTESRLALDALQNTGDASYAPRLVNLMNQSQNIEEKGRLLVAAAHLDADGTKSLVQSFLDSPDAETRKSGAQALAATEQSTAIPTLLSLLSDTSLRVRSCAAEGLVSLTRFTPSNDGLFWHGDPSSAAPYWVAWIRDNPQLPVHPIRECRP